MGFGNSSQHQSGAETMLFLGGVLPAICNMVQCVWSLSDIYLDHYLPPSSVTIVLLSLSWLVLAMVLLRRLFMRTARTK
jgi:hypothetical protein